MFTNSKLPYALLLIAIVAITWLLLSDNRRQPSSANPAHDQVVLERLESIDSRLDVIDSRLDVIESGPGQIGVSVPNNTPAAVESELKALIERIAVLEERETAERTSSRSDVVPRSVEEKLMARQQSKAARNEPPAAATHFEESDNLEASEQVALEDVETIFESADLPNTMLSSVNCKEGYCRMEYKVNEAIDPATKEIEENEMFLKLNEKYGNGTKVHMGRPTEDGSMQIYIELPREQSD
jgi:hypothetical protein